MKIENIQFTTTDWAAVEPTEHPGITGRAFWRTRQFGEIRVRMVDYTPGYRADHVCSKGHIILIVEGELETELADGRKVLLKAGSSYCVADGAQAHLSATKTGARLFIVD